MGDISEHFSRKEFACHDLCKFDRAIDVELITILEEIRSHFNSPIKILSGLRCARHNRAVGGAADSQHLKGTAADIVVTGTDPEDVYTWLYARFPKDKGIGKYKTFTHFDVRAIKARWIG